MSSDAAAGPPMADTSDMYAVHRVFRDALESAPSYVGGAGSDAQRVELVGGYYDNVLALLAVHHEGEDLLLWPRLLERLPDSADRIRAVADQHGDLHDLLPAARAAVAQWVASPDDTTEAALLAALDAMAAPLLRHLDQEEEVILPLAGQVITAPEWGELPEHGTQNYDGDKLWLVLGLLRENLTQEQRDLMIEHMPPPAVEFWTQTGEGLYLDYVRQLRA